MKGRAQEILTIAEMTQADRLTIEGGLSEKALITNAGQQLAGELCRVSSPKDMITLCCGVGNNAADGFASAYNLLQIHRRVRILSLLQPQQLKGEAHFFAQQALALLSSQDFSVAEGADQRSIASFLRGADILVDALFGTGLNRAPHGAAALVIRAFNKSRAFKVAVDLPSGINGDSAMPAGEDYTHADHTVTFFRSKLAHHTYPAAAYCGKVICVPIGIQDQVLDAIQPCHFINSKDLYQHEFRTPNYLSHKYNRGHALVFAGEKLSGAGALACMAAQRAGAGLVTQVVAKTDPASNKLPASCILRSNEGKSPKELLTTFKASAALIGPGSGVNEETAERTLSLLQGRVPLLLDADALSCFADKPDTLLRALRAHGKCVLTPHLAEFQRVFPHISSNQKSAMAQQAADETNCAILLKGADTVIAEPSVRKKRGRIAIHCARSFYLATGGTGDVLGGIVVSLLAQGMSPFAAACAGVDIHSHCARLAGVNLIAEDLIDALPQAYSKALRHCRSA